MALCCGCSELLRRWQSDGVQTVWGNPEESGTAPGLGPEPGRYPLDQKLPLEKNKINGWRLSLAYGNTGKQA